jgi:K+-sensing histidine kinase KdpD
VLTTTAPLALRRVYPIAVFRVVLLGVVAVSQDASFITFLALVFAAYSAIVHSRFRGAAVLSVVLAGVLVTAAFANTEIPQPGRLTALFVLIPVVLVGNAVRRWRHQAGDSQERPERAEAEHRAATVRALAASTTSQPPQSGQNATPSTTARQQ